MYVSDITDAHTFFTKQGFQFYDFFNEEAVKVVKRQSNQVNLDKMIVEDDSVDSSHDQEQETDDSNTPPPFRMEISTPPSECDNKDDTKDDPSFLDQGV